MIRFARVAPRAIPVLLTMAVAVPTACTDPSDEPPTIGAADAYSAIIRWEATEHPPVGDGEKPADPPVIYVAAALGDSIDATTQASVVDTTKDEATVRFADSREDVVDMDDPAQPVKDDNVMLLVGPFPQPARSIEVDVVRYRSLTDQTSYSLVLSWAADGARVTSATEAPG